LYSSEYKHVFIISSSKMPYSCTINGTCEDDRLGRHQDLATCQANCKPYQGEIIPDILYDILTLNLEDALDLAPSDIVIVLFRLTGLRVSLDEARRILTLVIDKDYLALWEYEEPVKEYVRSQLEDEIDLLILDTVRNYDSQPEWGALRNKVIRRLTHVFQERDEIAFDEILEDVTVTNLDELVRFLQGTLADDICDIAVPLHENTNPKMSGFLSHWDYIVERFGPTIPYQQYITPL